MTGYIGLLMVAYFYGCDPLALGEIDTPDQLTILMATRVLSRFFEKKLQLKINLVEF